MCTCNCDALQSTYKSRCIQLFTQQRHIKFVVCVLCCIKLKQLIGFLLLYAYILWYRNKSSRDKYAWIILCNMNRMLKLNFGFAQVDNQYFARQYISIRRTILCCINNYCYVHVLHCNSIEWIMYSFLPLPANWIQAKLLYTVLPSSMIMDDCK